MTEEKNLDVATSVRDRARRTPQWLLAFPPSVGEQPITSASHGVSWSCIVSVVAVALQQALCSNLASLQHSTLAALVCYAFTHCGLPILASTCIDAACSESNPNVKVKRAQKWSCWERPLTSELLGYGKAADEVACEPVEAGNGRPKQLRGNKQRYMYSQVHVCMFTCFHVRLFTCASAWLHLTL